MSGEKQRKEVLWAKGTTCHAGAILTRSIKAGAKRTPLPFHGLSQTLPLN